MMNFDCAVSHLVRRLVSVLAKVFLRIIVHGLILSLFLSTYLYLSYTCYDLPTLEWRQSVVSVGGMEVEAPQAPRTRRRKRPVGWEMGPLHSRL